MDENKIYATPKYKCAICGEIYDSVQERMNCEMKCIQKQKEEEKKAAEAKKKAEREALAKEASEAIDKAYNLVKQCVDTYGYFHYEGDLKDLDLLNVDYFPSKLWHHWWF